jgi:hypothetical protein
VREEVRERERENIKKKEDIAVNTKNAHFLSPS